jgi:hypothetical protein
VQDESYGQSGLYNSLYQSALSVDSVTLNGGKGNVLIGDVRDEPRFVEQIRQTVRAVDGVSSATIPNGLILRGPGEANYNLPWSWHLDPETTTMAEVTIEVCDGAPSYVEANLDEFVDTIGQYCPWSAELIHVEDLRSDDMS